VKSETEPDLAGAISQLGLSGLSARPRPARARFACVTPSLHVASVRLAAPVPKHAKQARRLMRSPPASASAGRQRAARSRGAGAGRAVGGRAVRRLCARAVARAAAQPAAHHRRAGRGGRRHRPAAAHHEPAARHRRPGHQLAAQLCERGVPADRDQRHAAGAPTRTPPPCSCGGALGRGADRGGCARAGHGDRIDLARLVRAAAGAPLTLRASPSPGLAPWNGGVRQQSALLVSAERPACVTQCVCDACWARRRWRAT